MENNMENKSDSCSKKVATLGALAFIAGLIAVLSFWGCLYYKGKYELTQSKIDLEIEMKKIEMAAVANPRPSSTEESQRNKTEFDKLRKESDKLLYLKR